MSIVIPVLHEQEQINGLISHLRTQDADCEIIVVDSDADGSTLKAITDQSVLKLIAPKGRGMQLAAGIESATGEVILMLHADTRLPDNGLGMVADAVRQGARWGAFRLGIDAPGLVYRVIERTVDLRCKLLDLPYGDQGIFVTRPSLLQAGGVPRIPLMEDVALVRSLAATCGPCTLLPLRVQTSPRRWEKDGISRRTLKNWWLLARYKSGADPSELAKEYR